MNKDKFITLSAGGGGKAMNTLISGLLFKYFNDEELHQMRDASYIDGTSNSELAFCTDSFIVKPEFFNGGNIGKLAVAGTVNDLAVSGAIPLYLSCGLIVPEGYSMENLEKVISAMAEAAKEAGVRIVTGDTKVMPHTELSGLIINTSGIGKVYKRLNDYNNIKVGDKIIVTSDIARHGIAITLARKDIGFYGDIESDCCVMSNMLRSVYDKDVKFIRDATRGGVAAVLNEVAKSTSLGMEIKEELIPLDDDVKGLCEALGFDPLAVANEGVAVIIASKDDADTILETLKTHPYGKRSSICGVVTNNKGVVLETSIGGKRFVDMPLGEILPRIC